MTGNSREMTRDSFMQPDEICLSGETDGGVSPAA